MHSFLKKGKTKSRYTDTKNRRELCSRFKMMFYVTALKFKDGTVVAPIHSLTVPKRIEWWVTVFSLSIPPALGGFATSQSYIVFSCKPSFEGIILYHKTRRKSRNLRRVLNIFRILGNTNNFYSKNEECVCCTPRFISVYIFINVCYNRTYKVLFSQLLQVRNDSANNFHLFRLESLKLLRKQESGTA